MINVIWYDGQRGRWDHGLLLSIFDKHPDIFIQYNEVLPPKETKRSIVVVAGCPSPERLYGYLSTLPDSVVILVSDEDAYFDWKSAIPSQHTIITQYWNPELKGDIKERILLGAPARLKDYKINTHLPKKYLWSFIGQVQNEFRQKCVDVLKTLSDGFLHIVPQFGGGEGGIEYQDYLDICCQSRFVICPSGSMTAETFRAYEAMECGAIPICDQRSPRDVAAFNYWREVYPYNKLHSLSNWEQLPELLKLEWEPPSYVNKWWFDYKKELEQKLLRYATN